MITKPTKIIIIFFLFILCGNCKCLAQDDIHFEVSAKKAVVSDSGIMALLDTIYHLIEKCEVDKDSLFITIHEEEFEGENIFWGEVYSYVPYSYIGMFTNEGLKETDVLYWPTFYCFYNGLLCIIYADHENIFKEISKSQDKLSVPTNTSQVEPFHLTVAPHDPNNQSEYDIYSPCD